MSASQVLLVVAGTLLFLVIGSFICVIIDRLPVQLDEPNEYGDVWDTRPWPEVLGGRSRCSSCGEPVRPVDNIPVLSWLVLRGRCRDCGERIPGWLPLVELLCPLLFLGAVWAIGLDDWRLLLVLWLIPVGVAIAVIDQQTLIVPTRLVWPSFFVSIALAVLVAALEGEWSWLVSAAVGVAVLAGPLFLIWFIHPRGMGFGDVRLTVLLGWNIGFFAGTRPIGAVVLTVIALFVASAVGLVLGLVVMGARGRKAQVPFGPALIISAFLCMALAPEVLEPFAVYQLG